MLPEVSVSGPAIWRSLVSEIPDALFIVKLASVIAGIDVGAVVPAGMMTVSPGVGIAQELSQFPTSFQLELTLPVQVSFVGLFGVTATVTGIDVTAQVPFETVTVYAPASVAE